MQEVPHYIVHFTVVDPGPDATFGTTPPIRRLEVAVRDCLMSQSHGRRAFITARNSDSEILYVIATADYPVAGEASVNPQVADAIRSLADDMDWTI